MSTIRYTVPIQGPGNRFMWLGTAWSRMKFNKKAGRWERVWYATHGEAMSDMGCRGEPREDLIDSRDGAGPKERR